MKLTFEQVKNLIQSAIEEVQSITELQSWIQTDDFHVYAETLLEQNDESSDLETLLEMLYEYEKELNELRLEKYKVFETLRRASALIARQQQLNISSPFTPEIVECAYIHCSNTFLKDVANKLYCSSKCRENAKKMRQRHG